MAPPPTAGIRRDGLRHAATIAYVMAIAGDSNIIVGAVCRLSAAVTFIGENVDRPGCQAFECRGASRHTPYVKD